MQQFDPRGRAASGRTADAQGVVHVRIDPVSLFAPHDHRPTIERAIAEPIEAYIVAKAGKLPPAMPVHVVLHLPPEGTAPSGQTAGMLAAALPRHFAVRRCELVGETRQTLRRGWRYLALGMALLTVCMVAGYFARTRVFGEPYGTFVEQALSVFGWVANWRPAEILLYERLNARQRLALYGRLAVATVEVCKI